MSGRRGGGLDRRIVGLAITIAALSVAPAIAMADAGAPDEAPPQVAGVVTLGDPVAAQDAAPAAARDDASSDLAAGVDPAHDEDLEGGDDDLEIEDQSFPDPFEAVNRRTFAFNRTLDGWVISPLAATYGFIAPSPVKVGVRNFLANLEAPVRLVNDLLQGEWRHAGTTFARFAVNTVAGGAGLVDTATHVGIPAHDSDFGQTLAAGGVGSGPYLVVPILGPTTLRDGIGALVDTAINPALYVTGGLSPLVSATIETGAGGIAEREARADDLRRLEESSVDHYAAMRSAWAQNRMAEIAARRSAAKPPT